MKKNEDGYILLWTFMALTIFILLISALLVSGSGRLSRSKRSEAKRQQAFTAKSVADVLADAVCNHPEETPGREILERVTRAQRDGEDYDSAEGLPSARWEQVEGLPREMGECRIRIWYQHQEQTIAISARAGRTDEDAYVLTLLLCPEETAEAEETTETEQTEEAEETKETERTEETGETAEAERTEAADPEIPGGAAKSWKPCRYREETR